MDNVNTFIASLFQVYVRDKSLNVPKGWLFSIIREKDDILVDKIQKEISLGKKEIFLSDIIHYYMNVFSEHDQKENGIYYTPQSIVDIMNNYILKEYLNSGNSNIPNIIDPAVGGGMFLYDIALKLSEIFDVSVIEIIENNLYGIDILPENVLMAKGILALTSLEKEGEIPRKYNLLTLDSLSSSEKKLNSEFGISKFDIVTTNPPYVRSKFINEEVKKMLSNYKNTVFGIPDLYIPFFELGMNLLNEGGIAAYITPNSYFRSLNGKKLRRYLQENTTNISLINFDAEQLFEGVQHYSAITFFTKKSNSSKSDFYFYRFEEELKYINKKNWKKFTPNEVWNTLTTTDKNLVDKAENCFETTLSDLEFKNGIATQRNSIYSFNFDMEDEKYYYFSKESIDFRVEKTITRPFILPNTKIEDETLRIIFPYYYNNEIKIVSPIPPLDMKNNFPECLNYLEKHREELALRKVDKKMKYWYLYGRSQGLSQYGKRLYLPYMASKVMTTISKDDDEVFAAGYAIFDDSEKYLKVISKIIESNFFSYYVSRISKPYTNGFYSTAKNMIKNFSIPSKVELEKINTMKLDDEVIYDLYSLTNEEKNFIENEMRKD
ncbi:class I SAM-dependent DNA methyltransferase [Carnobacterium maltaromaticum]|uniref:HsdM family class I SAM-dependent methyltransferase n=1 Tax=Carnobacterium maltaromaticum TaxID=2751 RepID=UPI0039AEE977